MRITRAKGSRSQTRDKNVGGRLLKVTKRKKAYKSQPDSDIDEKSAKHSVPEQNPDHCNQCCKEPEARMIRISCNEVLRIVDLTALGWAAYSHNSHADRSLFLVSRFACIGGTTRPVQPESLGLQLRNLLLSG